MSLPIKSLCHPSISSFSSLSSPQELIFEIRRLSTLLSLEKTTVAQQSHTIAILESKQESTIRKCEERISAVEKGRRFLFENEKELMARIKDLEDTNARQKKEFEEQIRALKAEVADLRNSSSSQKPTTETTRYVSSSFSLSQQQMPRSSVQHGTVSHDTRMTLTEYIELSDDDDDDDDDQGQDEAESAHEIERDSNVEDESEESYESQLDDHVTDDQSN